jgi:adenylate cyclase
MIRIRQPPAATALTLLFVLAGAAWGGFLGVRHVAALESPLDRFESISLDWRYLLAGVHAPPRGVVIAAIDDATIAQAGSFPLPRSTLARIVRGLGTYNPQVIAIDILLLDPGPPQADLDLVEALRSTKTLIAAAALFDRMKAPPSDEPALRLEDDDLLPQATQVLWPQEKFRNAARSGLTNVSTDHSGVPRYVPLLFEADGRIVPSLALRTAAVALNTDPVLLRNDVLKLAARSVGTDLGYNLPLRFYGPKGSIRTFSAILAANGELDADDVQAQVVVIGSTAAGVGDYYATPFDRVPGVEVLATAISNLLAGDALVRDGLTRRIDASVAIALPIMMVLLLTIEPIWIALALTTFAFGIWILATHAAFLQGYWASIAVPVASAIPVAIAYGVARLWVEHRAAKRLAFEGDALGRFQPPRLRELLTRDAEFLSAPVYQHAAIVFVDLSGFTAVTESVGPAWTRELLLALHELIETAATSEHGLVVSYMGDGAMIVFGLPAPRADDACRALRAITNLHHSLSNWIANLPPVARERLALRIGAHFGPVVLSRLGAATHQHITATGDTVNVASRLMEIAKERDASVAVSDDLYRAAMDAQPEAKVKHSGEPTIEVAIRGRVRPILVRVWPSAS